MRLLRIAVSLLVMLYAGTVAAQEPRMFPGTTFPGYDLYEVQAKSPDECAAHCAADSRCSAFTFTFQGERCALKWAVSRYDGSMQSQSGIITGRQISPPSNAKAPPPVAQPTAQPPAVVVVPVGPPTSCSAKGNVACKGCSVTCPPGKQATCSEGELTSGGGTPGCWTQTKCECK